MNTNLINLVELLKNSRLLRYMKLARNQVVKKIGDFI